MRADRIENPRQHRRFHRPMAAEAVMMLVSTPHCAARSKTRSISGKLRSVPCTHIEHHNPFRYCYLQGCCLCCPGLANLAPHLEAFQSNSTRREDRRMTVLTTEAVAVIEGRHADPFRYLGPHVDDGARSFASFSPAHGKSPL